LPHALPKGGEKRGADIGLHMFYRNDKKGGERGGEKKHQVPKIPKRKEKKTTPWVPTFFLNKEEKSTPRPNYRKKEKGVILNNTRRKKKKRGGRSPNYTPHKKKRTHSTSPLRRCL